MLTQLQPIAGQLVHEKGAEVSVAPLSTMVPGANSRPPLRVFPGEAGVFRFTFLENIRRQIVIQNGSKCPYGWFCQKSGNSQIITKTQKNSKVITSTQSSGSKTSSHGNTRRFRLSSRLSGATSHKVLPRKMTTALSLSFAASHGAPVLSGRRTVRSRAPSRVVRASVEIEGKGFAASGRKAVAGLAGRESSLSQRA